MKFPFNVDEEFLKKVTVPKPKYLYKYHEMNLHLMEMLTNAEFYMSKKADLNDPFDSSYTISLENYLHLYYLKHPLLKNDNEQRERLIFLFNRNIEKGNDNWVNDIDELPSKLRISCFTEESNNALMWSHYANNHTGVCLKFELDKDLILEEAICPVNYTEELINVKEKSDFTKCLLTKLKAWEIEKEWRIISDKQRFPFKQEALVEITFGLKVPDSTMSWFKQFRENLYYGHTPIFKLQIRGNKLVKIDEYDDEVIYIT